MLKFGMGSGRIGPITAAIVGAALVGLAAVVVVFVRGRLR